MPIYTNIAGSDQPAPIESTPVTPGQGDLAAISKGFQQAPSEIAAQAGLVSLAGGTHVSQADAAKQMTEQGYPADHIPAGGLTTDALRMIMNRQSILKRDDYALARSGNGGVRQFVGQMIGGLPDPINAAAWIFAPEAKVGQGFAAKFATGAAVQGGINAASSLATMPLAHTVGDDYSMSDVFTQTTLGVLLGGFGHGFAKGVAPAAALTTDQVTALERSAAYAKQYGISPDEVISHVGAVGVHQVMPSTARGLGLKGTDAEITEQLKNPAVNKTISQKLLDQNAKDPKLKGDPEAQAIAYNAGPKRAYEWIKAGRNDGVLPKETQDYVKRLRELTGTSRIDTRAPEAVPQGTHEETPNPFDHVEFADNSTTLPRLDAADLDTRPGLVVARRFPDGTIKYGKPGDIHADLISDEEMDRKNVGYVGIEEKDMGFAKPGGPFMSREEAAASIGKTGKLESVKYNEGEPPAFGKLAKRNVVSDLSPQVQPDLLKTAIAQAGDDSKVNVEPVLKQSVAEMYGVKNPSDYDPREAKSTYKLTDYFPQTNTEPTRFNLTIDKNGEPHGAIIGHYDPETKAITIEIVRAQAHRDISETANSIGPAGMRSILRQLREKYPEATSIGGERVTGARPIAGNTTVPLRMTDAIPQPGSAEHAKLPIEKPEEIPQPSAAGEKGPLAAEAQKALANDTAELKAIPEGIRKEGEPETVAADNAIRQNEELHKATEAAVRCGLTRGLG